jgi:hypothetical protein
VKLNPVVSVAFPIIFGIQMLQVIRYTLSTHCKKGATAEVVAATISTNRAHCLSTNQVSCPGAEDWCTVWPRHHHAAVMYHQIVHQPTHPTSVLLNAVINLLSFLLLNNNEGQTLSLPQRSEQIERGLGGQ